MKIKVQQFLIPLIFLALGPVLSASQNGTVAEEALRIAGEWNEEVDSSKYLQWLHEATGDLRVRIAGKNPANQIEAINRYLFEELRFRVRGKLESPDLLFLDRVIDGKAGYCVGLATLYLSLGERLRLPLYAVATPGHVFVRYDDGKIRRNIELTEKGRELSDEEYIRRFRIPDDSIENGVFLRNLSEGEFLGQILNNRAVLSSQQEDYKRAGEDYRRALKLDPLLQAVYYNRGNDRVLKGKYRKALKDLTRAIDLNPNDFEAWNNRGVCFLKMGKEDQARRDFEKAVAINPGFQRGVENLRKLEVAVE